MLNTPSITSHLVAWLLFFFDWPPVVWVQPHILAYRIHPTFFPPIIWRRRTILPDSILRRMTGSPSPQIPDTSRILVTYYLIQGNNGILDKDNFSHSFKRVVQAGTPLLLKMFHLSPPMYSWLLPTRHACMPLCLTSQRSHPLGLLWGCTSLLYSVKYITVW